MILRYILTLCGPGSSAGTGTDYGMDGPGIESRWGEIFRTNPSQPWGPPSLLYNGYRVFPGGKVRPVLPADHSPSSRAVVMEEWSYNSTHPLGHNRAYNGNTLPLPVYDYIILSTTCFGSSYEPSSRWLLFLSRVKCTISKAILIVTYEISYNIYKKTEVILIPVFSSIKI